MIFVGFLILCLYIVQLQQSRRQHQMSGTNNTSDEESDGRMKPTPNHHGVAARFRSFVHNYFLEFSVLSVKHLPLYLYVRGIFSCSVLQLYGT